MPANIDSMFSTRVAPWHGLGQIIQEAPDSAAAIVAAGLDWEVAQHPIFVDGSEVPLYRANVRTDSGTVLGIVTDRYTIVQNKEAFSFADALVGGGEVKYETAGALREGRQVWMLAKMNREYDILGDKIDPYLCFVNSHDGTGAVRVLMTPIRVVCQNTLNMAIRGAQRSWSTTHVGDIAAKMSQAQTTLGLAEQYMVRLNEEANKLVDIKLSPSTIQEIVHTLLPIKERTTERAAKTIQYKRDGIMKALVASDISKFNGTGWAVINAVSDFVGHAEPARKTASFQENNFSRVINGETLFDKAYDLLRQAA